MNEKSQETVKTIPRKRRPRAVGEVFITTPSSQVYLNSELNEKNEINEPIYENTSQPIKRDSNKCGYKKFTTFARSITDGQNKNTQLSVISTYVGV